jgi:sugar lactone lactonase YvrE
VVLSFTGLSNPSGVAVNMNGAVWVTDTGNNRVVELPASSPSQTVLGFTDLNAPSGLTLDNNSNVFVADATTTRWLWASPQTQQTPTPPWQATSSTEWVGPFSGLQAPRGVVSSGSNDYVVDSGNNRVLRWKGGNAPDVVPFTGLNGPDGLAVTYTTGDVWVVDTGNNRVLRLQNFNQPTPVQTVLPLTGLSSPHGVALDTSFHNNSNANAIILFVTDTGNNRVVKLTIDDTAHTATQSMMPFAGLNKPTGVTVDGSGNLYVVDSGNNRVLKLDKAFAAQ